MNINCSAIKRRLPLQTVVKTFNVLGGNHNEGLKDNISVEGEGFFIYARNTTTVA